jgi:hypothetical protein
MKKNTIFSLSNFVTIGHTVLRKRNIYFAFLFCLPVFIFSQSVQTESFELSEQQKQEIENIWGFSTLSMEVFDIDKQNLNAIVKSQGEEVILSLSIGTHNWEIKMWEAPIIINDPVCNIYRGELTNTSCYSRVYLHVSDDYFYGYVYKGNKRFRITSPPELLSNPISQEFLLSTMHRSPPPGQNETDCFEDIEPGFKVFPNPASTYFKMTFEEVLTVRCELKLYNNLGKLMFQKGLDSGSQEFRVELLGVDPGIYFYELERHGEAIKSGKLVVAE